MTFHSNWKQHLSKSILWSVVMTGLETNVFCDIGMRLGIEGHTLKNTCQIELEQVVGVTVGSEIRDYVKIIKKKKIHPGKVCGPVLIGWLLHNTETTQY